MERDKGKVHWGETSCKIEPNRVNLRGVSIVPLKRRFRIFYLFYLLDSNVVLHLMCATTFFITNLIFFYQFLLIFMNN